MEVSLEENVIGVFRLIPETVWTVEVKINVPPRTIEISVEGLSVTFPAKSGVPALRPPPHPELHKDNRIAKAGNSPHERNLPMHSSSDLAVILQEREQDKLFNELENL